MKNYVYINYLVTEKCLIKIEIIHRRKFRVLPYLKFYSENYETYFLVNRSFEFSSNFKEQVDIKKKKKENEDESF